MAQFKTVAGPKAFQIKKWEQLQEQIGIYGEIISRESAGGWEFYGIYPVQINKKPGFIQGLLGGSFDPDIFDANMLVFKKD
jgi:hypothetical protein